jgi:hypothetical protein
LTPEKITALKIVAAKKLMEAGYSQRKAAAEAGVPQATLSETLKREGWTPSVKPTSSPDAAGVERNEGGDLTITSPVAEKPKSPPDQRTGEELLRKHGYDPEKYVVTSVRVSEWGNPDSPMFQHRVNARRKDNFLILPSFENFTPFKYGQIEEAAERRVAFIPDLHAPFEDEQAVGAVLDLLAAEEPEDIIFLGDAGDHTRLSKHRTHPRFNAMLNATNDRVAQNFRRFREACERARMKFIPGNHDDRILYYAREVGGELAETRPGKLWDDEPDPNPSLGYRELYRLDDLGIELVDEDWQLASLEVAPELTAQHGYLTGPNSEKKMLEKEGRSQVHAHTHHGSVVYRTKHNPLDIRVVLDAGTLSQVAPDGLGYAPKPDWTPGIGWGHIWDTGLFHLSFLPFVDNKLLTPWGMAFEGRNYDS